MTMKHTRATDVTVLIECVCGHVGQVDADAINSGDAVTLCCTSCGIRQSYRFGIPVKDMAERRRRSPQRVGFYETLKLAGRGRRAKR
jgi:hypothetical protein